MGKILKQSFWSTIIIYVGVLLGFINSIILFPKYLSTEQIGLIRQIISASTLLLPLTTFGVSATYLKFFPSYKEDNKLKNEFLSIQFFLILTSFTITIVLLVLFSDNIKYLFTEKSKIFFDYYYIVFSILFIMTISSLFEAYLRARYNIILSNFTNGVLNRFLTAISIVLLSLMIISFDWLIKIQVPIYLTGLFIIIIYAYKKENFNINIKLSNIKNQLKEITNYSFFSILSGFANILVLNVDVLMVTAILGLSATGIYTTSFYIGLIIEIPRRAISQISIPLISENIKNNNLNKIEKNFKLVSLHQLIIGVFLYLLITLNLDNIFNIIPNSENFISGKNIVYIIGLSKLIIMTSGFSSELIMMSKYYKFNVITITILAILSVILNYILIPKFGMIGAAYASLISILIFNIIKLIFIKIKIGISPFSNKTISPIIIGIIIFFIINYFPSNSNPFLDIIKNSLIISSIYLGMIYLLRVSPELNLIIKKIINYQKD